MRTLLATLLLFLMLLPGTAFAQEATAQEKQAIEAATSWLALVDGDHYPESWQNASTFFRGAITEKDWATALTGLRKPLGPVESRTEQTAKSATSLPGVPDGHYVVMTFATAFAKKKTATETVTCMQESDGKWRVAGYFIR